MKKMVCLALCMAILLCSINVFAANPYQADGSEVFQVAATENGFSVTNLSDSSQVFRYYTVGSVIPKINYTPQAGDVGFDGITVAAGETKEIDIQSKIITDGYQNMQISYASSTDGAAPNTAYTPSDGKWTSNSNGTNYKADMPTWYGKMNLAGNGVQMDYMRVYMPNNSTDSKLLYNKQLWNIAEKFFGSYMYVSPSESTNAISGCAFTAYAGSGSDADTWKTQNFNAYAHIDDTVAPTLQGIYFPVDAFKNGNPAYLTLKFSEIVNVTDDVTLQTSMGTFTYLGGSGTNAPYFVQNNLSLNALYTSKITLKSLNGDVSDLAGNSFTLTEKAYTLGSFLTQLKADNIQSRSWEGYTAKWAADSIATKYRVILTHEKLGNVVTVETSDTSYDFEAYMTELGKYWFNVVGLGDNIYLFDGYNPNDKTAFTTVYTTNIKVESGIFNRTDGTWYVSGAGEHTVSMKDGAASSAREHIVAENNAVLALNNVNINNTDKIAPIVFSGSGTIKIPEETQSTVTSAADFSVNCTENLSIEGMGSFTMGGINTKNLELAISALTVNGNDGAVGANGIDIPQSSTEIDKLTAKAGENGSVGIQAQNVNITNSSVTVNGGSGGNGGYPGNRVSTNVCGMPGAGGNGAAAILGNVTVHDNTSTLTVFGGNAGASGDAHQIKVTEGNYYHSASGSAADGIVGNITICNGRVNVSAGKAADEKPCGGNGLNGKDGCAAVRGTAAIYGGENSFIGGSGGNGGDSVRTGNYLGGNGGNGGAAIEGSVVTISGGKTHITPGSGGNGGKKLTASTGINDGTGGNGGSAVKAVDFFAMTGETVTLASGNFGKGSYNGTEGYGLFSPDAVVKGGSLKINASGSLFSTSLKNDQNDTLSLKELDLGIDNAGKYLTAFSGLPEYYGTKDIYCDESGKAYFYLPSDFDTSKISAFTADGLKITGLENCTATIESDNTFTAVLIFAAYNASGQLIDIDVQKDAEITVGSHSYSASESFNTAGADKTKVMLWDSMQNIIPLCDAKSNKD